MSGEEGEVAPPPGETHTAVAKEEVSLHSSVENNT